jgi:hypothetical protein
LYQTLIKNFNWSLCDIDNAEFETMIEFIFYKAPKNENEFIHKGKTYIKAQGVPKWL